MSFEDSPKTKKKILSLLKQFRLPEVLSSISADIDLNKENRFCEEDKVIFDNLSKNVKIFIEGSHVLKRIMVDQKPSLGKFEFEEETESKNYLDQRDTHIHFPFYKALMEFYTRKIILKQKKSFEKSIPSFQDVGKDGS